MDIVLGRYLNKRFIELRHGARGEVVGVLTRFGDYRYVRWLGFVGRQRARELGKPVKLEINRIGRRGEFGVDWDEIPPDKHVQGCLTPEGVYAVLQPWVRLL